MAVSGRVRGKAFLLAAGTGLTGSSFTPHMGQRRGAGPACHNAAVAFDLVIRGATVVTPGRREAADIGIADGKIAQVGGAMTGATEIAAGGLLALPGGIDAH